MSTGGIALISAELSHNPYLLNTTVKFNGQAPKINSQIEKYEKLPLKDWVHLVPEIYYNEMNGYDFNLYFIGTKSDYEEIKKAFLVKGISEEDVRISHKNEIEDADTKSKEVDALISWLKNTPNCKFDFDAFWRETSDLFESSYPFILVRGSLPTNMDSLLSFERVDSATELKNTDLTSTPIVFYIEEKTKPEFRRDLEAILKRHDVRKEQLFFMISPELDRAQVTRVISDLGVEKPQVIENYNDDSVMMFIRNYPITEFIRTAIQLFRSEVEKISDILDVENKESKIANAEVHKEIEELESDLNALKDADDFFVQRDNYEAPYIFKEIQQILIEQLLKWKSRKTKITGENEIKAFAQDYIYLVQSEIDRFISSISAAYKDEWNSICKDFSVVYANAGIDTEYFPTDINLPAVYPITIPEIKTELLKLTIYEEAKNDFFGFLKKTGDVNEPVMIATCYLEQWRNMVQDIIMPVVEKYIEQCIQNLSEYYDRMAEAYHQHLSQLVEEKTKDKEIVLAQLSDDERRLQEDNDWLSMFKEQLQTIERD
jgi:flavodoxin